MAIRGSCLCGSVSYEITGAFRAAGNCHCATCRKSHGAAFATWPHVDPDQFRWTAGVSVDTNFYVRNIPGGDARSLAAAHR